MNNDPKPHVNTAQELCTAFSKLFYKGSPRAIAGVYLVFAGFNAMQAIASLGRRTGAIYIIPEFVIEYGEVVLRKFFVADGITYGDQIVRTSCDPIRYPDGSVGLLADLKCESLEYCCLNEHQLVRRTLSRPRNAAKLIARGRRAVQDEARHLMTAAA